MGSRAKWCWGLVVVCIYVLAGSVVGQQAPRTQPLTAMPSVIQSSAGGPAFPQFQC